MSELFDIVYGMVFQPAVTLRRLAQSQSLLGKAVAVVVLVAVVEGAVVGADWVTGTGERSGSSGVVAASATLAVVWRLATWFAVAGILDLVAESFGGNGRGLTLLSLLGFCQAPGLLLGPVALIPAFAGSGVRTVVTLALGVWVAVLAVIAVRESHSLSGGRSAAAVLLPLAVVILLALGSLAIIGAAAIMKFPGFTSFK
ncbi:MAG: YIP1 family protein [Firmicutes bacterium]|nr:YIP1 family protein [Bacillota bacterium]